MLKDLGSPGSPGQHLSADVVVVGAGIAGTLLASRLARQGIRTIVLESGGRSDTAGPHPLNEVVQTGHTYRGAQEGRCRGLGGTSMRWGGAMLPFLPCDLEAHTARWPIDWPVSLDDLIGYFAEIEEIFRLPEGSFELPGEWTRGEGEPSFIFRSAKWPVFRRRNVARILRNEIKGKRLEVWLNATATRFHLDESSRLAAVVATGPSGNELTIEARVVVFAAGAIESTRLLLLLDAQHGNRVFKPQGILGRYFFDHLSATAAIIDATDRRALNLMFGMRFERSGMRDLRIEPSMFMRKAAGLPAAFAHVAAKSDDDTGFTALRAIYRDLQSGAQIRWRDVRALSRDLGWLAEATWWRFVRRRLLAPRTASFELVLVLEQFPHHDNTIALAPDCLDRHGNPLARIDWRPHEQDLDSFRALQSALTAFWADSPFARLGKPRPVEERVWRRRLLESSDVYHPGGSTRMGRNAASGVVDANLRTFSIENLFVVSTSTFPSGGGANPTFMLMSFALRAADLIARELSSGGCPVTSRARPPSVEHASLPDALRSTASHSFADGETAAGAAAAGTARSGTGFVRSG